MLNKRIIARLDIKGPNLVKGIHLEGLRVLGLPSDFAHYYYENGADETGDEKKHERLREGDRSFQVAIQIAFGDVGDADQLGVQPTAFLRHRNHFQGGTVEQVLTLSETGTE